MKKPKKRKKRKKRERKKFFELVFFIFLVFLLLLISGAKMGCKKQQAKFDTSSLTMSFVSEAPPQTVSVGQPFPIILEIKNDGNSDIGPGEAKIYLSGFGSSLVGVETKKTNNAKLTAKSMWQEGSTERIVFAQNAIASEMLSGFNLTLKATACYPYSTETNVELCIAKQNGVCSLTENKIKSGSNSAAPLQITSLTEQVQGNKLWINFVIENKGVGKVYLSNSDCDKIYTGDIEERFKEEMVDITIETPEGIKCMLLTLEPPHSNIESKSGVVRIPGKTKVTCYKQLQGNEAYIAPFKIKLNYMYSYSLFKKISIVK